MVFKDPKSLQKIALLAPFYEGRNHSYFLGVGYLSSVLKQNGFSTMILDEDAVYTLMHRLYETGRLDKTRRYVVEKLNEYDPECICLTINTCNYQRALELLRLVRLEFPAKTIIVGGPHITTSWNSFRKHHSDYFDVAVIGEGEETIVEVCKKLLQGKTLEGIKGAITPSTNPTAFEYRELIQDLDSLPLPDREGFHQPFADAHCAIINEHFEKVFYTHLPGFKGKKYTRIVGSRGCDFSCNFCSPSFFWRNPVTQRPKRRLRSAKSIVDEIECLCEQGFEAFYFDDPTFPFKSKSTFYAQFIKELSNRELEISWAAPTRYDELTPQIIDEIVASGFTYTYFGLETYQESSLTGMGKSLSVQSCLKTIKKCIESGIHCDVSYQVGLPGQSFADIIKSIQWLEQQDLQKHAFFSIAAIWPETKLANEYGLTSDDFEPAKDKSDLLSQGLYYFVPGNQKIERYYSNCSGTFHFISEDTAIKIKHYLIDAGFIKRFNSKM